MIIILIKAQIIVLQYQPTLDIKYIISKTRLSTFFFRILNNKIYHFINFISNCFFFQEFNDPHLLLYHLIINDCI